MSWFAITFYGLLILLVIWGVVANIRNRRMTLEERQQFEDRWAWTEGIPTYLFVIFIAVMALLVFLHWAKELATAIGL